MADTKNKTVTKKMRTLIIHNIKNKQIPNINKYISHIHYTQSYTFQKGIPIASPYVFSIKDYNDSPKPQY